MALVERDRDGHLRRAPRAASAASAAASSARGVGRGDRVARRRPQQHRARRGVPRRARPRRRRRAAQPAEPAAPSWSAEREAVGVTEVLGRRRPASSTSSCADGRPRRCPLVDVERRRPSPCCASPAAPPARPRAAMLTHGHLLANVDQMLERPRPARSRRRRARRAARSSTSSASASPLGVTLRGRRPPRARARASTPTAPSSWSPRQRRHDRARARRRCGWRGPRLARGRGRRRSRRCARPCPAPPSCPRTIADALEDRFGLVVREGYGLTEASPVVTTSVGIEPRRGSVGKAARRRRGAPRRRRRRRRARRRPGRDLGARARTCSPATGRTRRPRPGC